MTVIPSLSYKKTVSALQRAGFVVGWQTESHIHMVRRTPTGERIGITVPAYKPVPRFLLAKIIKQACLTLEEFQSYL